MLAAIHGVDLAATGLSGFGRPEGYLERQLARWQRQWELSVTREVPGYDRTHPAARGGPARPARFPAPGGTLVHGDYRLDNMLVTLGSGDAARPAIAAVVDWEMSTLGDPLADLGLALVYWARPDDGDSLESQRGRRGHRQPGVPQPGEIADRYAAITGRDVSALGYYMAFGCFKLAVVLEGIHARFLQHQTVGEGFEREGPAVPLLIARGRTGCSTPASLSRGRRLRPSAPGCRSPDPGQGNEARHPALAGPHVPSPASGPVKARAGPTVPGGYREVRHPALAGPHALLSSCPGATRHRAPKFREARRPALVGPHIRRREAPPGGCHGSVRNFAGIACPPVPGPLGRRSSGCTGAGPPRRRTPC